MAERKQPSAGVIINVKSRREEKRRDVSLSEKILSVPLLDYISVM
jgi:hypothetical protein